MAPPPEKIRLPSVVYTVEIQNGEMDSIQVLIADKKTQIAEFIALTQVATTELATLQQQMIVLYIQATGSFPR